MADFFNTLDQPAASIATARGSVTSGNFTATNVGSTWTQVTGLTFSLAASVGDHVMFVPSFLFDPAGTTFIDIAVKVSGTFVRYASSGTGTPATEGDPSMYPSPGTYRAQCGGVMDFIVEAGDLDGANVVFAVVYKGTGTTAVVYASADFPFRWRAINFGAV